MKKNKAILGKIGLMERMSKSMQQSLYQTHIAPLIDAEKPSRSLDALLNLAEHGFVLGIKQTELDKAKMYQLVCSKLLTDKASKDEVIDTLSMLLRYQQHYSVEKMNASIGNRGDSSVSGFANMLEDYKVHFEVMLRDLLTPVYLFAAKHYGKKINSTDAKGHILAGADRKVRVLSDVTLAFGGVDISVFMSEIDSDIRNAAAHSRWRLLDKDRIEINPKDKEGTEIILTKKELEDKLKQLKKVLWSMRAGFFTFIENIDLEVSDVYYSDFSVKEIEDMSRPIDEKVIIAEDFEWGENTVSLKIRNKKQERNPGGEIYSASGSHDIVSCIERLCYVDRVLGFLTQYLSYFTGKDDSFNITIDLSLDEEQVGVFSFSLKELRELNTIVTSNGKTPEAVEYIETFCNEKGMDRSLRVDVRSDTLVPLGQRKQFIKLLKEQFGDIDVEFLTID